MASYYNPSKWLSEYAAALLSPYIKLENDGGIGGGGDINDNSNIPQQQQQQSHPNNNTQTTTAPSSSSSSSLSVGLWSGNVELKNVELRPEAFEKFLNSSSSNSSSNADNTVQIKWKLIQGSIDSIKIQIPWTSLLVGSAHSSSKCSEPSSSSSSSSLADNNNKKNADENKEKDGEEEEEEGCTTIHIKGVKLQLGYEVIIQCHDTNNNQQNNPNDGGQLSFRDGTQQLLSGDDHYIQEKIRDEKNRILQTAEGRLLAGLDPFPTSLMKELQSSIQSIMQQQTSSLEEQNPLLTQFNEDIASTANISDTAAPSTSSSSSPTSKKKSYRSRMENYLSSTIKSLLWSVFDSLSISITQVQLSVVGSSHYDKDFKASIIRRRGTVGGVSPEKSTLKQHQQQQPRQKKNMMYSRRDFRNVTPSASVAAARARHHRLYRHASSTSSFGRMGTDSTIEGDGDGGDEGYAEENVQQQSGVRGSITDDPSIWAREGQVELGITLDKLDVRPGPLPSTGDNDGEAQTSEDSSIALKLVQIQGAGVYLRRTCPHISKDGGAWDDFELSSAEEGPDHKGKTLVWNDMNTDDYVVLPTYMEASCRVYRTTTGSPSVRLESQQNKSSNGGHSTAGTMNTKGTATTGQRRGKRDKKRKPTTDANVIRGAVPVLESSLVVMKRPRPTTLLSNTTPSTATATTGRGTQLKRELFADVDSSFTPPHRLDICLEVGHVRSSLSPRQLFLLHSVTSSLKRIKRGRPSSTIRAAKAYDCALRELEGQSIRAWEERIYREIPELRSRRSRQSTRTLPGVVFSWWRYAYLNVLNEIQERKLLLSQCSGDTTKSRRTRGNIFTRMNSQQWQWKKQSSIRKEYIELYLIVYNNETSEMEEEQRQLTNNISSADRAAVTAAKLRLEQMEGELSLERILLLKHVARATSIRRERGGDDLPVQRESFRETMISQESYKSLSPQGGRSTPPSASPNTNRLHEEGRQTVEQTISSGTILREPKDTLSISASFFLSGFSLAVCDYSCSEGTTKVDPDYAYQNDDVSVLTGFSDVDDDSKTPKEVVHHRTRFDPLCQFWPTSKHGLRCDPPILLMHMSDVMFSVADKEHEFSVGGISVQPGFDQQQAKQLLTLGYISTGGESSTFVSNQAGVSGYSSSIRDGSIISIGPAEIIIDWGWLDQILKFASANRDVEPSKLTVPLESEDVLVRALSRTSARNASTTIDFDRLSLTIPIHKEENTNDKNYKLLVTTVRHLHIEAGNLPCMAPGKSFPASEIEEDIDPNGTVPVQLFNLDGLDTVIVRQDKIHAPNTRTSTRLLRHPIKVQVQYSSGTYSLEQEQQHSCQSFDVKSSAIHVLVSDDRLMTVVELMDTIFQFNKATDTSKLMLPKPFIQAMTEYMLAETKVSIQSVCIHIFNDSDNERSRDRSYVRGQLEVIIASYISQLSCLDFHHPDKNAVKCISRAIIDRCCALGMSEGEARKCTEVADANYRKEACRILNSSSSHDMANARRQTRRRTANNRNGSKRSKSHLADMDPQALSHELDDIVDKVTLSTIAEFDNVLQDQNYPNSGLVLHIESLVASRSLFYYGSKMQTNVRSIVLSNEKLKLLSLRPVPTQHLTKDNIDDGTETALTITSHDRIAVQDHGCHQEIYFEAGSIESTFVPEAYIEAIKVCKASIQAVSNANIKAPEDVSTNHHTRGSIKDITINGSVSSFTVVLTDKLLPFIECKFQDVVIEKSIIESQAKAKTLLQAGSVIVDCAYQSTYPNIISTYPSNEEGQDFAPNKSAFSIQLFHNPASSPNEILIGFDGVRVMLLRQILNEILQYTLSPKYGVGLFLSRMESESEAADDSSQTPSKLKVSINKSSIILPKDSRSIDMVGLEVDEICIARERVSKTWSTDGYSFQVPERTVSDYSDDAFFDCIDNDQLQTNTIPRYVIYVRQAHIFTALNKNSSLSEQIHMPEFNANVHHTGRVEQDKSPFMLYGELDKSIEKDIKSRVWEKVTTEPLDLGIKVDYAPMLRLFVEDYGGVQDNSSRGISLDLRMSQFYLIMSTWFSNMQELPVFFQYGLDLIKESSTNVDLPEDWPEYGTSEFVTRLIDGSNDAEATFEMAIAIKKLSWRCSFDHSTYFASVPPTMPMMEGSQEADDGSNFVSLTLGDAICSITMDDDTLQRIAVGATSIKIHDGRKEDENHYFLHPQEICTHDNNVPLSSFVDLNWGLDCGRHTLVDGLPLPFQLTVFLTPDRNCLINLGLDMAEAHLANLTPIWILLDYFGLYFKELGYGHPAFEAEMMVQSSMGGEISRVADECDKCINIDFRLWTINPHVTIPSEDDLHVMLEAGGLYYRYKSLGLNYSSQEIVARDLAIVVLKEYMDPSISRGIRQVSGSLLSGSGAKTLVDGLSFSIRYDYNSSTDYTKFALRVPLTSHQYKRDGMHGIESSYIEAKPFYVPPPVVCKPFITPSRTMGHHETSIHFSYEYMKLALKLLTDFVGPKEEDEPESPNTPNAKDTKESLFSVTMHIERVKLIISDPIMGMHRPILSICFPSVELTASRLDEVQLNPKSKFEKLSGNRDISCNPKDLQASMKATIFIDYFKLGLTRNWEPFVEPFKCLILYEKSALRGNGITFNADCPLHFNITSDLIETMDDASKTFNHVFGTTSTGNLSTMLQKRHSSDADVEEAMAVETVSTDTHGINLTVVHSPAEQVRDNERVAFSLRNSTGEQVRVHTHSTIESDVAKSQTTIAYLDHLHLMPLSFPATYTTCVYRGCNDLQSVEVLFKGDQNIAVSHHQQQLDNATSHKIDLQIPGFRWVRNISFDLTGKHFVQLIPRSPTIRAKINEDWRLRNALHMLTEVTSVNGGRRLTVNSPFEVINKTNHPIILAINSDPRHSPDNPIDGDNNKKSTAESNDQGDNFAIEKINPDETQSISYLLLESALQIEGNHLGSIWIRPDQSFSDDFKDAELDQSTIGFPSRPMQLAKVLHESSVIFKDSGGDPSIANQVASGVEISCPIFDQSKSRSNRPFCYVVEIKRSPFVRSSIQDDTLKSGEEAGGSAMSLSSPSKVGKGLKTAKNIIFSKTNAPKAEAHAPIAYSLIIHPPLMIENLLPSEGRFELMDANSKHVIWSGSLEAGERKSVFTVGLDAPLLLLVNLGFCRTAVGEGALVHHGGGDGSYLKAGWSNLGSAMKTSGDRIKKTLTTITESKDNRGKAKLGQIKTGNMRQGNVTSGRGKVGQLGFNTENDIIESSGGEVLKRSGDGYGMEDIATELNVIDSLGQRLTLLIDNVLGSGGQRHVSLYSPFWIVNTTEHSLRYKQEKAQSFVSGTVLSAEKDGSKPVDGGQRCTIAESITEEPLNFLGSSLNLDSLETVFSGRPGAMSMVKKILKDNAANPASLAALISEDLPLPVLSKLAFMFNFQEVLSIRGSPRLCIQLADTRSDGAMKYTSAWSSGFGLESIGVTQIVGMHCKDGRKLEASVSISIAPGRLSNYTKIVRICPRYVVVNQLPRPIRLWQDNSISHPNLAVEHSSKNTNETQGENKWMFTDSTEAVNGIINQYELLFGKPTAIYRSSKDIAMDDQTTAHHDACYIATVNPSQLVAFHLPDTRLERLLRVDYGPSWYLSPSFAADVPGEHVLAMSQAKDLQMLPHVSSRGAPFYSVTFPPSHEDNVWNGELGVWFETEPFRRERTLIVKGIKEGSYASYFTDIIVGDQLMMIDEISVGQFTFDQAMKYLKTRLAEAKEAADAIATQSSPARPLQLMKSKSKKRVQRAISNASTSSNNKAVTLTFLTLGERLRRLRRAAKSKNDPYGSTSNILKHLHQETNHHDNQFGNSSELLVDMKFLFQSVFVFLRSPDPTDPPHRIINRSLHWKIYYRQRACDAHPWQCLSPGESASYTWEEPLKVKKLSVRVGVGEWIAGEAKQNDTSARVIHSEGNGKHRNPIFSWQFIEDEEQGAFGAIKTVKLEEIGYYDKLPCPARSYTDHITSSSTHGRTENSLLCQVDTEGATRVLLVSDEMSGLSDEVLVRQNLQNIRREITVEETRQRKIDALHRTLTMISTNTPTSPKDGEAPGNISASGMSLSSIDESTSTSQRESDEFLRQLADPEAVETELKYYMDYDEDLFITKRNQVVIEVMEATGLRSSDLNGLSNPYVRVGLVCTNKKRHIGSFRSKSTRSTYYVEKTLSPQWAHQSFVFNVPERASSDPKETRRYSLQCVVKSIEKFGKDKFLGQAHVHLRSLKDQHESVGWYPLMGKLGQFDSGRDHLDRVSGSLKLRVQWVHDTPGLMQYYILCAEHRLGTLHKSKDGMKRQLKSILDAAKEEKERGESSLMSSVPAMAALYKKRRRTVEPADHDVTREEKGHKVIKGVIATENKLKKTINNVRAAKFLARGKTSSLDGESEPKRHSTIFGTMLKNDFDEDDDDSSSDDMVFGDSLGSGELLVENNTLRISPMRSRKLDPIPPTRTSCNPLSTHQCIEVENNSCTQLLSLRWQNWQHYTNDSAVPTPPFYPSLNISRAYINMNAAKPPRPSKESHLPKPTTFNTVADDQSDMVDLLKLPPVAPYFIMEREGNNVRELMQARASFSKAARRSLGSVLNPGGVLTISPITALNLPEGHTGMFVKLRYGNKICLTETVDSRVAPVWNEGDLYAKRHSSLHQQSDRRPNFLTRQTSAECVNDWDDIAEMVNPNRSRGIRENDLEVTVLPFETSKSLRISIIGESQRLQSKVELGVLVIPLGPALECCASAMEDYEEDRSRVMSKGLPPAYVRWFPLMSPSEAVPIEGDMGKSVRPPESEKLNDNEFAEYFAPCIKLALMFRPNVDETSDDDGGGHDDFEDITIGPSTDQYMYGKLDRVSAALIDSSRITELLSFSSRDIDCRLSFTNAKTRLAVAVGNVQLDQSSVNKKVPVILSPTPVKHPQPLVQFLAWRDNYRSKSDLDSYEYVAIQLQEMDLKVEESWLYEMWEFYLDVMKKREGRASRWHQDSKVKYSSTCAFEDDLEDHCGDAVEKASLFLKEGKKVKLKKIYVRELLLGSFKVNLSYFKSSKNSWGHQESTIEVDSDQLGELFPTLQSGQQAASDDAYLQWSENMMTEDDEQHININIIGAVFPSISEAPIRFQERIISHVYESEGDIWMSLKSFYSGEALRQLYKIVGSLDFAGNPTMVLTSFRTGLKDFFLQPTRELKHITRNPSRVGVGVLKGTLSLLSNSTSGIFGFFSNLGATVGHTATMLTLDEHYRQLHAEQKAAQQRHYDRWKKKGFGHVTLMVSRPVHDVVFGVISASTGIFTEPYRGAKKDGLKGFTKGTAIGVIGIVVKPFVGVSDAFSHVMESVHDIAKSANLLEGKVKPAERYRLPYVFGSRRMLLPFNQVDARSAQLLLAYPLDKKTKKGDEVIVASEDLHMGNGIDHYIVVTTMRIILFRLKVVDGQGFFTVNVLWQVRLFEKGARIRSSLGNRGHNVSILYVSRYSSRKQVGGISNDLSSGLDGQVSRQQGEYVFAEESFPGSTNSVPKSFYPLGATTAAFRLRNAWPFTAGEDEGDEAMRFAVEGDFKQREQLSRIHNAICCMTGDIDSTLYEGRRKDREGVTTFGPLIFEHQQEQELPKDRARDDLNFLYRSLEQTRWKHDSQPCPGNLFSEPSWLLKSRARGLAASATSSFMISQETIDEERTSDSVSAASRSTGDIMGVDYSEESLKDMTEDRSFHDKHDSFENECQSIDSSCATPSVFVNSIGADQKVPMSSGDDGLLADDEREEQDKDEDSMSTGMSNADETRNQSTQVPADLSATAPSKDDVQDKQSEAESSIDGRLRRVEAMLECLVDSPTSNVSLTSTLRTPSHISQYDHEYYSETSSVNTTTLLHHESSHVGQEVEADDAYDVEALKKEIEDLKKQLAAKDSNPQPQVDRLSVDIPPLLEDEDEEEEEGEEEEGEEEEDGESCSQLNNSQKKGMRARIKKVFRRK